MIYKGFKMIKKIISVILFILFLSLILCAFASCGTDDSNNSDDFDSDDPNVILRNILKSYRTGEDGMTSWWEILAVYNADENPMDYKGFDEVLASLEGETNAKMASYVIVTNIAVIIGAHEEYFERYDEYKSKLKELLENPADNYTVNDYIFAYLALKTSGMHFDETPFYDHLIQSKKPDGGFAISGDSGDVDMSAFAVQAWRLFDISHDIDWATPPFADTISFLESQIGEDGTFSSFGSENANSTACALSAFIAYPREELTQKIFDALMLFKAKGEAGYAFLRDGKADAIATVQTAIALVDFKNKTSVWEKLWLDALEEFVWEE